MLPAEPTLFLLRQLRRRRGRGHVLRKPFLRHRRMLLRYPVLGNWILLHLVWYLLRVLLVLLILLRILHLRHGLGLPDYLLRLLRGSDESGGA